MMVNHVVDQVSFLNNPSRVGGLNYVCLSDSQKLVDLVSGKGSFWGNLHLKRPEMILRGVMGCRVWGQSDLELRERDRGSETY